MSLRSNGSYIGPRPVGPSSSVASGIWDLRTAERQKRAGAWPGPVSDPDFANVSLLLHMDGSNGSTTFTDSSSNAFTVTANGNAQISTAESQFGGASGLFDGTGDYLSLADNADFDFGTGDFTIECWIKPSSGKSIASGNATGDFMFATDTFNAGDIGFGRNGLAWDLTAASPGLTAGWNHVAVTRSGTTLRILCNGSVAATGSGNTESYNVTNNLWIGARSTSGSPDQFFNGYIDEFRITKGVARWTGSYTVPTAPF